MLVRQAPESAVAALQPVETGVFVHAATVGMTT
jgi:hypothetical protein